MSNGFVPLTTKALPTSAEPFRVKVMASAGAALPFHPAGPSAPVEPVEKVVPQPCDPKVTLVRDGERITGIRVQCGCGEVIDLQCGY